MSVVTRRHAREVRAIGPSGAPAAAGEAPDQLVYTSILDRTRTVIHDLVYVKRYPRWTECVTTTGLEFVVTREGNVQLVAGGNQKRTIPPEAWELRSRHTFERPVRCGIGGVVA